MGEVSEGGNKFLMELKNALRKLHKSEEEEEDTTLNSSSCTSDTLTTGDTSLTLNDATMSSAITMNGDVNEENNDTATESTHHPEPSADHKAVPYVAAYDSKVAQKGLAERKRHQKPNGIIPGTPLSNEGKTPGLKVQVSDMDTPEGSNASSPKTMSTVYSSDKESTLRRQRSDSKAPSPAPWPISEDGEPASAPSHRPPRCRNMKVVQADLYNELNSVLKKRNQMTRRSSILELERQKGCKTIVYFGRGGTASGQLVRKSSLNSGSPSPLAAARGRTGSVTSKPESLAGENTNQMVDARSALPPSGKLAHANEDRNVNSSTKQPVVFPELPDVVQGIESKIPEAPLIPPRLMAAEINNNRSNRTAQTLCNQDRSAGMPRTPNQKPIYENVSLENHPPCGPAQLLADLTQHFFSTEEHASNSEPSEADSIASKELEDLRKVFDSVDSRRAAHKSPTEATHNPMDEERFDVDQHHSPNPRIRVEIQWPKEPPPSFLHDELKHWHERLSGKWKNQDEDDVMQGDEYNSDGEEGILEDSEPIPDGNISVEAPHPGTSPAPRLQLPRAALSPSTRQRLQDMRQTTTQLFPETECAPLPVHTEVHRDPWQIHELAFPIQNEDDRLRKYRSSDTEEEKESSIDFSDEIHPGSLVSQLVDRVRASSVSSPTARVKRGRHYVNDAASDASSELSVDENHPGQRSTTGHQSLSQIQGKQLPPGASDMSLTSVTSYEASLETSDKHRGLGQSSNETLVLPHSGDSSAVDLRYTSGSSINPQSKSGDSVSDLYTTKLPVSKDSSGKGKYCGNQHRHKLGTTSEEKRTTVICYPESSGKPNRTGSRHRATKSDHQVKFQPHLVNRESSRGTPDEKFWSLDRVLIRKCKHVVQCALGVGEAELVNPTGDSCINCYANYATYPPPNRAYSPAGEGGDDTLTNLMITHSGDPLPPPSAGESSENRHNCISANVTVPQPTSFHRHGNNVGDHLINPHRSNINSDQRGAMPADSDGFQVSSSCTDYDSGADVPGTMSDPCQRLLPHHHHHHHPGHDSESGGEDSKHHHFQKKHITVLDKENQRHLLFQTWSSNAAKKARDRGRIPHWRRGSKSLHAAEESDSSPSHKHGRDQESRHHLDHRFNDGRRSSKSMVKSRLLRHVDSFSSCDAPCGEMGVYHQKRDRAFSPAESVHSACTYVVESQEHSSDGDTESLYQDYEQYEQSLIQYVRTEDLSQINEDIRSLYWQQFDSMSLPGLPGQNKGLLRRLVCCFFCEHNHRPNFPERPTSSASSSKIFTILHDSGKV